MARFTTPAANTLVPLAGGCARAVAGLITIHAPTAADIAALRAAGCTLVPTGAYFALPAPDEAPAAEEPEAEMDQA